MILPLILAVSPVVLSVLAEDPRVLAVRAAMPAELAGLVRGQVRGEPNSDLIVYGGSPGDPVVVVSIFDPGTELVQILHDKTQREQSLPGMARMLTGRTADSRTEREGWFVSHADTGTRGFFGEYATKDGLRQGWATEHDGVLIIVKAMIPRAADRQRVYDAIMRDLFGGATLIEANK